MPGTAEEARKAILVALVVAKNAHDADGIDGNWDKQKEILGVMENLKNAFAALQEGQDAQGRPITPELVGQGLLHMLEDMKNHAIWFRLHANAPDATREKLDELQRVLEGAMMMCAFGGPTDAGVAAPAQPAAKTAPQQRPSTTGGKAGWRQPSSTKAPRRKKKWWQFWK